MSTPKGRRVQLIEQWATIAAPYIQCKAEHNASRGIGTVGDGRQRKARRFVVGTYAGRNFRS
jgi:hypothetical protein